MKKMSRKERERAARRELIIDAAEQVISQRGFENATMDEIAEQAELGKGTLYLYFKNKLSIYMSMSERGSRLLNEEMAQVLTMDLSGLKMIEKLGMIYLNFIQNNPHYFQAFNYYEGIADETLAKSEIACRCEQNARQAMTYIVRSIQIGMQDGSINDEYDPKELGVIIWGASKGIMHMAYLKEQGHHYTILNEIDFNLRSLVQNFIQLVGTGIKKND